MCKCMDSQCMEYIILSIMYYMCSFGLYVRKHDLAGYSCHKPGFSVISNTPVCPKALANKIRRFLWKHIRNGGSELIHR